MQAVSSKAKETAEVAAAWYNFSVLFDLGAGTHLGETNFLPRFVAVDILKFRIWIDYIDDLQQKQPG